MQLKITISPPAGSSSSSNGSSGGGGEQVLVLSAPVAVAGDSNSKWEEHALRAVAAPPGGRAQPSYKDTDGAVEIWTEFVPHSRTLWRRAAASAASGAGAVAAGAVLPLNKTLAEAEFGAYQDLEASLATVQALVDVLQRSASDAAAAGGGGGGVAAASSPGTAAAAATGAYYKGVWASAPPGAIAPGPRAALLRAGQALAYLGTHVTEDAGLNTRLLGILQPQVPRTRTPHFLLLFLLILRVAPWRRLDSIVVPFPSVSAPGVCVPVGQHQRGVAVAADAPPAVHRDAGGGPDRVAHLRGDRRDGPRPGGPGAGRGRRHRRHRH